MSEAVISAVRIAAAHDGEAELLVTLAFANGGTSQVALDEYAARTLLDTCKGTGPDDLVGVGWEHVRDALIASSKRYSASPMSVSGGGTGNV